MTKSAPEQFIELIEHLILLIEAQIGGGPLPNRMAAPAYKLVRNGLRGIADRVAAAMAAIAAGLNPAPPPRIRAPHAAPAHKPAAKPLGWRDRLRAWWTAQPAPAPIRIVAAGQAPAHPPRLLRTLENPKSQQGGSKASIFFFEKKKQKTSVRSESGEALVTPIKAAFERCAQLPDHRAKRPNESFLLLFFKKEDAVLASASRMPGRTGWCSKLTPHATRTSHG